MHPSTIPSLVNSKKPTNSSVFLFSFTDIEMSSSSVSVLISPRKLRSDLRSRPEAEDSEVPLVISVLASLIERTMARNRRIARSCMPLAPARDPGARVFDCREAPDMSVQAYLERIFRYTRASAPVFVVAYVYIDRFCHLLPTFRIGAANVHRLLITTIMVASKYVEDMNYRNLYYAKVGGLTMEEMNKLELEFLFSMGFKMHVNVSVFESYCSHLEREVSIGGGYQIERTLSCSIDIKSKDRGDRRFHRNQIARIEV